MIKTNTTIFMMPKKLAAFKKYIEKYECTYFSKSGIHTIFFYKENAGQFIPYILLITKENGERVCIYVNKEEYDLSNIDTSLHFENFIFNDMKRFIEEIRKCKVSNE